MISSTRLASIAVLSFTLPQGAIADEVIRYDLSLESPDFPNLDADPAIDGPPGSEHLFTGNIVFTTSGFTGGDGIQGWSCALWHAGVDVISLSELGTVTAEASARALQNNAFVKYEIINAARNDGKTGVVQAVILAYSDAIVLPPNSSQLVGKNLYRARLGDLGATAFLRFENNLRGSGQPVANSATVRGTTVRPDLSSRRIRLGAALPPESSSCDDGVDNDRNGWIDCDDPECRDTASCVPEACGDGVDNDRDGAIDCLDLDCRGDPACPEICGDGLDNDQDDLVDCRDVDCDQALACRENCTDAIDNNEDGLVDCDDPDCFDALNCRFVGPERCQDGVDNDRDGKVDCQDEDCKAADNCRPIEFCDDAIDNDEDGLVDCADPGCFGLFSCPGPENCRDLIDNDQDGKTDCDDPDCAGGEICQSFGEICEDGIDNNANGKVDCADLECRGRSECSLAEVCPDGLDNDSDGLLDCEDSDCAGAVLCEPGGGGGFDLVIGATGSARIGPRNLLEIDYSLQRSVPIVVSIAPVPRPQPQGVQGWSISILHDLDFMDFDPDGGLPTTAGTNAAARFSGGFAKTEAVDSDKGGQGGGFISAVVLSFTEPRTLDPTRPQSIVRARYVVKDFAGDGGGGKRSGGAVFRDGLRGSGQPVQNALTIMGTTVAPAHFVPLEIQISDGSTFVRGDANGDRKVNVADAIWVVNELVRRGPAAPCPRAANVNADGFYDLADAVFLIRWLFQSGPTIPPPFPECGVAAEAGDLECPTGSVAYCAG